MPESARHPFPLGRWLALAWLAVYLPSYAAAYDWFNFLFLCNLGVVLTAYAYLAGDRLVISSQALAAPAIGLAWSLDAGWRLVTGVHLYGGTEYMWDSQYPLLTRTLSLYHLVWPFVALYGVRRLGYDRRGWALQTVIAAAALGVARAVTPSAENVNFAFRDPLFGHAFAPALLHLAIVLAVLSGVAYGTTHFLLERRFGRDRAGGA